MVNTRREQARKDWEKRFLTTFQEHGAGTRPSHFNQSLTEALEDLPGHCLRDLDAYK